MTTELMKKEWTHVLKLHKSILKKDKNFAPALVIANGKEMTAIVICGTKNGDALKRVIRNILKEQNPDFYILAVTGWSTDFGDNVFGDYPEYEHVSDMPPDDRAKVYIQIMVAKSKKLIRSYVAEITTDGELIKGDYDTLKSKFILSW